MEYANRARLAVSDEVVNGVLINITEGHWKPGEKIPSESHLCTLFQVSRVSVRAALQKLQGLGVIHTVKGVGSFVTDVELTQDKNQDTGSRDHLHGALYEDFYAFRLAIEFKAYDLFVVRATDHDIEIMKKCYSEYQNANDDPKKLVESDFSFHHSIFQGSKNDFIINAMEPYHGLFRSFITETHKINKDTSASLVEEHAGIYNALLDKQPGAAKQAFLAHGVRKQLLEFKTRKQITIYI